MQLAKFCNVNKVVTKLLIKSKIYKKLYKEQGAFELNSITGGSLAWLMLMANARHLVFLNTGRQVAVYLVVFICSSL